jgi:hypothetical protein
VESTYTDATVDACGVVVWVWTRTEWFVLKGTVSTTAPIAAQTEKLKQVSDLRGTHGTPGTVPVAFCYHKRDTSVRFPLGTSIIDDTAKAAQLIYNEMSRIEEYHRKTSPFLAIPTEEKSGVLDPEVAIGVGPDTAMGYSSTAGAPTWVTPPSDMPAEIRTHCLFIAQSAFKSAGLEVEVDTSAQVQSGEALRVRSRGFESRARRFAANLRAWEIRMLKLASQWTKAQVEPVVTYPERYVLPDLSEDLARAIAFMDKFGDKLGPEGTATLINQALRAAATLSDDEAVSIIDEVHRKLTAPGATGTSEIFGYDLDAGLPTANEMRARKNLPPAEGGNVSVIVWKAVQEALAAKTIRDMGLAPASPPVGGAA